MLKEVASCAQRSAQKHMQIIINSFRYLSLCNYNRNFNDWMSSSKTDWYEIVFKNHSAVLRLLHVIRQMVKLIATFLQLSSLDVSKVTSVMVSDCWKELFNLYGHCFQLPTHWNTS